MLRNFIVRLNLHAVVIQGKSWGLAIHYMGLINGIGPKLSHTVQCTVWVITVAFVLQVIVEMD